MKNAGDIVHLRVELQGLWRLPRSNAIVFSIRCYLISLKDLVAIPKWGRRLHRVLKSLHPALVDYKGLTRYRDTVTRWLAPYDDGTVTTPPIAGVTTVSLPRSTAPVARDSFTRARVVRAG